MEFGLATPCDNSGSFLETVCGNAHYMAPQVFQGAYTKSCDIWSCGVLLCILLSGTPPFDGDDDAQIQQKVQQGRVDFSGSQWHDISQNAQDIIAAMFTLDQNQRPNAESLLKHKFISSAGSARKKALPNI